VQNGMRDAQLLMCQKERSVLRFSTNLNARLHECLSDLAPCPHTDGASSPLTRRPIASDYRRIRYQGCVSSRSAGAY
jgi:hypothetical protein